ncbi:MAG: cupin domain-containing protein [Acidobacteriota bacterium]
MIKLLGDLKLSSCELGATSPLVTQRVDESMKGQYTLGNLAALLLPVSADTFLSTIYGRNFCYIPGTSEKFATLFSWTHLNRILEQHRFDHKRCRLVHNNSLCAPESFRTSVRNRRGNIIERLQSPALMAYLRKGATLILDSVDELHTPITELAEMLSRTLHEPIEINAYASWGSSPGYGPHADNHDVFIIQIAGKKHWRILSADPIAPGQEGNGRLDLPSEFDQILHAGDLLYIPHSRIHEVIGVCEPSLHLTIGVAKRNGIHLLEWMLEQLRQDDAFNKDLPRFANTSEYHNHVVDLKKRLDYFWEQAPLQRFFENIDGNAPIRTHLNLPWIGQPLELPRDGTKQIRFAGTSWCWLENNGDQRGSSAFQVAGQTLTVPKAVAHMLPSLLSGEIITLEQFCQQVSTILSEAEALSIVNNLLENGVLFISD